MAHPLVDQLVFTRSEWRRGLRGTSPVGALTRIEPMNSIGWIVGHLAWHEQRYWLTRAQGQTPVPKLNELVASGGPASTPALREMLAAWKLVTNAADPWLTALDEPALARNLIGPGSPRTVGDALQRVVYHYWFHLGEILAIRQILGDTRLPDFVGAIDERAPYRPR